MALLFFSYMYSKPFPESKQSLGVVLGLDDLLGKTIYKKFNEKKKLDVDRGGELGYVKNTTKPNL